MQIDRAFARCQNKANFKPNLTNYLLQQKLMVKPLSLR